MRVPLPPLASSNPHDRTTTLAAMTGVELGRGWVRTLRLVTEALGFTAIGIGLTRGLQFEEPGLLSVFLAAGAIGSRMKEILRSSESEEEESGALSLLALFFGIMVAYAVTAVILGPAETQSAFRFALSAAHVGSEDLGARTFPSFWPLLGHNLMVLATVVVLAMVYRGYGALLALVWNAAVWGTVLVTLGWRTLESGSDAGSVFLLGLSILPHLGFEALAYALGAFAGALIGRRLTMKEGFRLPARPLSYAATALVVGSLLEANLPPLVGR